MPYSARKHGADGKFLKGEEILGNETQASEVPGLARGVERELKVVRVGPNPRMVICEYWECESRRTCTVNVRDNRKFLRGMKFRMEEPLGELEFGKAWVFDGRSPRRKGRW